MNLSEFCKYISLVLITSQPKLINDKTAVGTEINTFLDFCISQVISKKMNAANCRSRVFYIFSIGYSTSTQPRSLLT